MYEGKKMSYKCFYKTKNRCNHVSFPVLLFLSCLSVVLVLVFVSLVLVIDFFILLALCVVFIFFVVLFSFRLFCSAFTSL